MIELTTELENQFKEHSIDALKDKLWDNEVIVMFYYPAGSGTWLIVGAEQLGDDWLLYGYCHITDWEWSSVSFKELSNVEVKGYSIQYIIPSLDITVQQFKDDFMIDDFMTYPYNDFCDKVIAYIKLHTSQEYSELVRKEIVRKPNIVYESVNLPISKSYHLAVNLAETYKDYLEMPLSFVEYFNCLIYDFRQFINNTPDDYLDIDKGTIKGLLINTKKNNEYLAELPHRNYLDLSLIYYLDSVDRTAIITDSLAKTMNISELELYEIALDNLDDYYYKSINEISQLSAFIENDITNKMFVLTNSAKSKASLGLLSSKIAELSEELDNDLYVIPSSIHEYVILPCEISKEMVLQMHREVLTLFQDEDYLSDNVYYYNKYSQELSLIS